MAVKAGGVLMGKVALSSCVALSIGAIVLLSTLGVASAQVSPAVQKAMDDADAKKAQDEATLKQVPPGVAAAIARADARTAATAAAQQQAMDEHMAELHAQHGPWDPLPADVVPSNVTAQDTIRDLEQKYGLPQQDADLKNLVAQLDSGSCNLDESDYAWDDGSWAQRLGASAPQPSLTEIDHLTCADGAYEYTRPIFDYRR